MCVEHSLDVLTKVNRVLSMIDHIKEVARKGCWSDEDDFCPMEFSGGNFDDAYQGGKESGEVLFARYLLKLVEGE